MYTALSIRFSASCYFSLYLVFRLKPDRRLAQYQICSPRARMKHGFMVGVKLKANKEELI